jgi:NADPH-dependent curcumin reductase
MGNLLPRKEAAAVPAAKQELVSKRWILKSRPEGLFRITDAQLTEERLDLSSRGHIDDHVIVKVSTLSVDAFVRTMLDEEAYHGAISLGQVIPALGMGTVVYAGPRASRKVGSTVVGLLGAQEFASVPSSQVTSVVRLPHMSPTASLGLMGLTTGLTAYVGAFYVLTPPRRGQTVVVTGAAGAVGSVAAQLLKTTGARVIGIAGGTEKQTYLMKTLGLHDAIDYKHPSKTLLSQLNEVAPQGIDFVFDNVGGDTLDSLLACLNAAGRVVICGAISQYSGNLNKGKVQGPSNYLKLAERGATMKGFNVMQYLHRLPMAIMGMYYLYLRGCVQMTEHVEKGIQEFPSALVKMFTGGHIGKLLVHVSDS